MPSPPTSSVRFGLNTSAKAPSPGNAPGARPLFTSIAMTVRQMHDFESARQALRGPLLHQEGRRPEQDDLERAMGARILVPEALHGFRPARDLLRLVQYQCGSRFASVGRREPPTLPLRGEPGGIADRWLIGRDKDAPGFQAAQHLADEGGLAHLASACNDLQESAGLAQPGHEGARVLPFKRRVVRPAHYSE